MRADPVHVAIFVSIGLFCGCSREHESRENELIGQIDSLREYIRVTRTVLDTAQANELRIKPVDISPLDIRTLKRQGLREPLDDLARDLDAHPELLPQATRCEPGGRFRFEPDKTFWLTDNYVFANFDDGMCSGHILLKFTVKDSIITWQQAALFVDE